MPFLRFARDKRGYEHTYLVHASTRRGRLGPSRVLYWYRTPPGVKVGRPAFDAEARAKIELNNPGVGFDWKTLEATPMPPIPEAERWRERRRIERLVKHARRAEEADEVAAGGEEREEPVPDAPDAPAPGQSEIATDAADDTSGDVRDDQSESPEQPGPDQPSSGTPQALTGGRKRRRRGGRRHTHGAAGSAGPSNAGAPDRGRPIPPSSDAAGSGGMVQDARRTEIPPPGPSESGE